MKKNFNNKSFTLIEIIVILIIVGVLATLSLTQYFKWIDRSRSAEAILTLKSLADQVQACQYKGGATCFDTVVTNPLIHTEHFLYSGDGYRIIALWDETVHPRSVTPVNFPVCAQAGSLISGADHYGWIVLCVDPLTGTRSLQSGGVFQGMY